MPASDDRPTLADVDADEVWQFRSRNHTSNVHVDPSCQHIERRAYDPRHIDDPRVLDQDTLVCLTCGPVEHYCEECGSAFETVQAMSGHACNRSPDAVVARDLRDDDVGPEDVGLSSLGDRPNRGGGRR